MLTPVHDTLSNLLADPLDHRVFLVHLQLWSCATTVSFFPLTTVPIFLKIILMLLALSMRLLNAYDRRPRAPSPVSPALLVTSPFGAVLNIGEADSCQCDILPFEKPAKSAFPLVARPAVHRCAKTRGEIGTVILLLRLNSCFNTT